MLPIAHLIIFLVQCIEFLPTIKAPPKTDQSLALPVGLVVAVKEPPQEQQARQTAPSYVSHDLSP